tara:strand:- start:137 stop:322 length:186 start_codon:yes stop_codon:yes gene_type:complete
MDVLLFTIICLAEEFPGKLLPPYFGQRHVALIFILCQTLNAGRQLSQRAPIYLSLEGHYLP